MAAAQALDSYLEKPVRFTAVEAGADTTQLKDLQEQAGKLGYAVLKATAGADYIFEKAFKDAKLDNYAKELQITQPAKLQRAFVITPAGKLASKKDAEGFRLEGDVFTSMLSAVGDFMEDALTQSGITSQEPYKSLTKGNFTVEMVYNQNFTTAAIYEGHDSRVKDDLKKTHAEIDKCYGEVLRDWNGAVTREIESLENVLRENLFDTQKYTGEHDIATLKQLREQRRWKTLNAIENLAKEKKILFYLDNLEELDSATIEDLYHIARNAKDKFMLVGVYRADNINDEPDNKDLQNIIDKLKEEKLCETAEIKSSQSVYDVLPQLSENERKLLQIAALGATGGALLKALGLSTVDFANAYMKLQGKGLLIEDKVATRKLASKVAEEIKDSQTYLAVAKAIEDANKGDVGRFAGVLSDLYLKANDNEEAAKWAKTAAESALKNADLANALSWYRTSAQLFADNKGKIETLEKAVELGFYQINESWNPLEKDINELENIAKKEGDIKRKAMAKLFRGKVYISRGDDLSKAIKELESADSLFNEVGEQNLHIDVLNAKANALTNKGLYNEAIDHLNTLVELTKKIGNKKIEAKALAGIGFSYRRLNEAGAESPELYQKAADYFEQSLGITRITGDTNLETVVQDHLAELYRRLENMPKAELHLDLGIKLCQETNNHKLLLSLLTTRGEIMRSKGDLQKCIECNSDALAIAKKLGDRPGQDRAYFNIAEAYSVLGLSHLREVSGSPPPSSLHDALEKHEKIASETNKIFGKWQPKGQQ